MLQEIVCLKKESELLALEITILDYHKEERTLELELVLDLQWVQILSAPDLVPTNTLLKSVKDPR